MIGRKISPLLLVGLMVLIGCEQEKKVNPSKITIFFRSESSQNTFTYDAKLTKNGSILVFSTLGERNFEESFLEKPNFGFLLLNPEGDVVWDSIISTVLPQEKIGFPSSVNQSNDSTYIWAWNLTDGLCFIVKLELNSNNQIKNITANEFLQNDSRFDTLSKNYTVHQILNTSSGFALLLLGTNYPNFSVLTIETDNEFKSLLSVPVGTSFDPRLFFNEYVAEKNLPQNVISYLNNHMGMFSSPRNHFYYVAPCDKTMSFAIFSTEFSIPILSSYELDVVSIFLSSNKKLSACLTFKNNLNLNYFIKDITEFEFKTLTKENLEQRLGYGNVFLTRSMYPDFKVIIAQSNMQNYAVAGTTRLESIVLNVIAGGIQSVENFQNQINPYKLNSVIMSNQEAVLLGQTSVYRTYSRTFMIRIPYEDLFGR